MNIRDFEFQSLVKQVFAAVTEGGISYTRIQNKHNQKKCKTNETRNIALGECIPPPTPFKIKVKGQIQDHTMTIYP